MIEWNIYHTTVGGTDYYQVYRVKEDGTREVAASFDDEHLASVCAADLNAWEEK